MSAAEASPSRAALERALAAWNAGDRDGYLALYAEDVVLHGFPAGVTGREGAQRTYAPAGRPSRPRRSSWTS